MDLTRLKTITTISALGVGSVILISPVAARAVETSDRNTQVDVQMYSSGLRLKGRSFANRESRQVRSGQYLSEFLGVSKNEIDVLYQQGLRLNDILTHFGKSLSEFLAFMRLEVSADIKQKLADGQLTEQQAQIVLEKVQTRHQHMLADLSQ